MNKISIAALIEAFKQSLCHEYPIRNARELRNCKPKVKDFARGEVNNKMLGYISFI